ncbi:NUDIX hydrolase [Kocuria sp.]|uniref:NUDIX domain-containing protein n=1 Tax=Kocuria sp. TaxID=1871328 RepID=UPI0026DC43C9|nr:NUDIX hydrolase [Kocuria sp.]MDO4919879.1 NUDIX hydrolase [Kocuria sp.]
MDFTTITPEQLQDRPDPHEVTDAETVYHGAIWDVARETFRMADQDEPLVRDYITHPGAVAVLALDEHDRVLLINQYRHPVRMRMWEIPAGLLDVSGEPALDAARRELGEEADLTAEQWDTLVDFENSPGSSAEANRIFLARGLGEVPEAERFTREGEEAEIVAGFADLDAALAAVLSGRLTSPAAALGILAAHAARAQGWSTLRAPDAPWSARPHHAG